MFKLDFLAKSKKKKFVFEIIIRKKIFPLYMKFIGNSLISVRKWL